MTCREYATQKGGRLYHAFRTADMLADLMLHYFDRDYKVEFELSEKDPFSGLELENDPGAIKLEVDKLTNRLAQVYLKSLYPDLGFVGEESFQDDPSQLEKPLFWCVDPICGSMGYSKHTPYFGTSVALVDRQKGPLLGVLNCPALDICGLGDASGSQTHFSPGLSGKRDPGLRVLVSKNQESETKLQQVLKGLQPAEVAYRTGVPTKTLPVLAGEFDLYFALPQHMQGGLMKIWDLAASMAVANASGALFTDAWGNPLDCSGASGHRFSQGVVLSRDPELHARCLSLIKELAA